MFTVGENALSGNCSTEYGMPVLGSVRGLSIEVQQKLNLHRPETLGHAARVSGVTPAALALLLVHLKRGFKPAATEAQQRSA